MELVAIVVPRAMPMMTVTMMVGVMVVAIAMKLMTMAMAETCQGTRVEVPSGAQCSS